MEDFGLGGWGCGEGLGVGLSHATTSLSDFLLSLIGGWESARLHGIICNFFLPHWDSKS